MKRNNLWEKEKQKKNNIENGEDEETLVILGRLK